MSKQSVVEAAKQASAYLREEADFNRSWIDGRRGRDRDYYPEYAVRRKELAEERDGWADAIEQLASETK